MSKANQGISSYKRHSKAPYQYSEPYQQWKRAAMTGVGLEIARERHNRMTGMKPDKYARRDEGMEIAA
jgi:hypothetical protein